MIKRGGKCACDQGDNDNLPSYGRSTRGNKWRPEKSYIHLVQ